MQENPRKPSRYKSAQTNVANEVALLEVARQLWSTDLVKCIYTFFLQKGNLPHFVRNTVLENYARGSKKFPCTLNMHSEGLKLADQWTSQQRVRFWHRQAIVDAIPQPHRETPSKRNTLLNDENLSHEFDPISWPNFPDAVRESLCVWKNVRLQQALSCHLWLLKLSCCLSTNNKLVTKNQGHSKSSVPKFELASVKKCNLFNLTPGTSKLLCDITGTGTPMAEWLPFSQWWLIRKIIRWRKRNGWFLGIRSCCAMLHSLIISN